MTDTDRLQGPWAPIPGPYELTLAHYDGGARFTDATVLTNDLTAAHEIADSWMRAPGRYAGCSGKDGAGAFVVTTDRPLRGMPIPPGSTWHTGP